MWGKIIIPMYRLWLHSLYGLYGPWCPLSPKRLMNLISLSCEYQRMIRGLIWKKVCFLLNVCSAYASSRPLYFSASVFSWVLYHFTDSSISAYLVLSSLPPKKCSFDLKVKFQTHISEVHICCSLCEIAISAMPHDLFKDKSALVNTLRPRQDGCQLPDDIFKCIFLNENA